MESIIVIIIIALIVYYFVKKKSKSSQRRKKESTSFAGNIDFSVDNSMIVAYHLFTVYKISNGYMPYYTGEAALEAITGELLKIREYLDKKYIYKSDEYDAIIGEYNKIANEYKHRKSRLIEDSLAVSTSPDMQHCPSCLEDIGKEVTRARMCPKCKEKIIIYRNIPGERFLVNEAQNARINEMWKSIDEFKLPILLNAFAYSEKVKDEILKLINDLEEQEKLKEKAKNLTIDF